MTAPVSDFVSSVPFISPAVIADTSSLQDALCQLALPECSQIIITGDTAPPRLLTQQFLLELLAHGQSPLQALHRLTVPELPCLHYACGQQVLVDWFEQHQNDWLGLLDSDGMPVYLLSRNMIFPDSDTVAGVSAAVLPATLLPATLLNELFISNPAALVLSELETGAFVAVNRAFETLSGYQADFLLGQTSRQVGLFADPQQRDFLYQSLVAEEAVHGYEMDISTREGQTVACLFSGAVVKHEERSLVLSLLLDHRARKLAEQQLSTERTLLDTLIHTMPDLVWLKDAEGVYRRCNREFEKLAGVEPGGVVGYTDSELFPPEDAVLFSDTDKLVVESRQSYVADYHLSVPGRVYEAKKTPMLDTDGQLVGVLGVARDISERLQAEKVLTAERDLFAAGPVGVLTWLPWRDWQISYASPNITAILGYNPEQLCDRAFRYIDLVHDEDLVELRSQVSEAIKYGRDSWEHCYRVRHQQGHYIWLFEHTVLERNADGRVFQLRGYVMDDSERVEAENRLRLAASVFDHAHEGILVTDGNRQIVAVNPTFCEITGYRREEVLGRNPSILRSGHQDQSFYQEMWGALNRQGFWRGEISNRRKDGEVYIARMTLSAIRDQQGQLVNYVSVFADVTEMKKHQQRLETLAHYDSLTGLPNRVLLAEKLSDSVQRADAQNCLMAVCYLDLDGFKPVNDRYGHDIGDRLLVAISERLQACCNTDDCVARLGGDEFVLLLNGLSNLQDCEQTASHILKVINAPVELDKRSFQLSASIGITLYPHDPADEDLLLRHADQAMYQAKMDGRNQFHLYDPLHDAQAVHQREALSRISQALQDDEFVLFVQPKVDLLKARVLGFEALIRWNHPEKGILPPAAFLPLIHGDPLGVEIDHWVLRQAFELQQCWQRRGVKLQLGVNLNGTTVLADNFIERLKATMVACPDASPGLMEFEVLETSALEDIALAGQIFRACQALGFAIALDDFGTGYSSLTYFRRLPAETLKIDQSFVRNMLADPEDLAIVESVIGLGQAFNRHLIAEGVESADHGQLLVQLGCTVVQGYGIARPMPVGKALEWARHWQPGPEWTSAGRLPAEHRVLVVAEKEHIEWRASLLRQLDNGVFEEEFCYDHHSCRFGRWYYGLGQIHLGDNPDFQQMEAIHTQLHQLAHHVSTAFHRMSEAERLRIRAELVEFGDQLQLHIERLKVFLHSVSEY